MLSTLEKLNSQKEYLKLKIIELRIEIKVCSKLGYGVQCSKLVDEKDIYIQWKEFLENIIKEYEKE